MSKSIFAETDDRTPSCRAREFEMMRRWAESSGPLRISLASLVRFLLPFEASLKRPRRDLGTTAE